MRNRLLDILVAFLVVTIFWVPAIVHTGRWPGALLALGTAAAMIVHHRFSVPAAAALTIAGLFLGVCTDPMLATAWCLYPPAVVRAGRIRAPLVVLAALLAGLAVVAGVPDHDRGLLLSVVALTLSWLLGTMVGRQVEAERGRVQLAVARDIHDVVGHALGVIGAEAGVTRSLDDATEQELRDCLAGLEQHARGALTEVQTLVRSLRTPDSGADRLVALITAVRAAGVHVEARLDPLPPLDPRLTTTVFRIVQESLSNVIRHAPAASCLVEVRRQDREILISVRDDGPARAPATAPVAPVAPVAPAAPTGAREAGSREVGSRNTGSREAGAVGGSGLAGMRERARLVGGTLTFGSDLDGAAFLVEARLPVRPSR